jgi:hypothetical protein
MLAATLVNNVRMNKAVSPRLDSGALFEAWRVADQEARTAERVIFDQAMRSLAGMCDFPSSTRMEQTRNLRARANELFNFAMAKMALNSATASIA